MAAKQQASRINQFSFSRQEPRSHRLAAAVGFTQVDRLQLRQALRQPGVSVSAAFKESIAANWGFGVPIAAAISGVAAKYRSQG